MLRLWLISIVLCSVLGSIVAQVPQRINFQAIARDGGGNVLANQQVGIRLTVIDSSANGAAIYREVHSLQTNQYGSFNLQLNDPLFVVALPNSVPFEDIPWLTGNKHLQIDFDTTINLTFPFSLGIIPFTSVPYAFSADDVTFIDPSGAQDGDILRFDAASGLWIPSQDSTGGSSLAAGAGVSILSNTISVADTSETNEIQSLSISGNDLSISNGNTVTLPSSSYVAGNGINIGTGNTINAADTSASNELQNLSISGTDLSISNGNTVSLPTTNYTGGSGISIGTGNSINAADSSATNELQTLSLSGNSLSISNGNSVTLNMGNQDISQVLTNGNNAGGTDITNTGSIDMNASEAMYFGDPSTDGSWRIVRQGTDLSFERRETGTWVFKLRIKE